MIFAHKIPRSIAGFILIILIAYSFNFISLSCGRLLFYLVLRPRRQSCLCRDANWNKDYNNNNNIERLKICHVDSTIGLYREFHFWHHVEFGNIFVLNIRAAFASIKTPIYIYIYIYERTMLDPVQRWNVGEETAAGSTWKWLYRNWLRLPPPQHTQLSYCLCNTLYDVHWHRSP